MCTLQSSEWSRYVQIGVGGLGTKYVHFRDQYGYDMCAVKSSRWARYVHMDIVGLDERNISFLVQ